MSAAYEFAVDVVRRLRAAGFEALWAGGCVRDRLLGLDPKDYDVATNAEPQQVRELFGKRRTIEVGAAFGVVAIIGSREAGNVEVATFRRDGEYADGRHPESVAFSTAEHDAQRRDFTINGLFFDPIEERVIDYVGGEADLRAGIVRAIRDPRERFAEDKLRMLRAVRFSATFGFQIEPTTFTAIQEHAGELTVVSAERIAAEMRRMLASLRRKDAVQLLIDTGLMNIVLPEAKVYDRSCVDYDPAESALRYERLGAALASLKLADFPTALAILIREPCRLDAHAEVEIERRAANICRRWKLANEEIGVVRHLLRNESLILAASEADWPRIQRVLVAPHIEELMAFAAAVNRAAGGSMLGIEFCYSRLAWSPERLNPPLLLTGDDLIQAGYAPGPHFRDWLETVRDAQLLGAIDNPGQALELVSHLADQWRKGSPPGE